MVTLLANVQLSATTSASAPSIRTPADAKNVLFIAVDDLRPMMRRAYNFTLGVTPSLDQLSRDSLTFTHAYANYAFCSPSTWKKPWSPHIPSHATPHGLTPCLHRALRPQLIHEWSAS